MEPWRLGWIGILAIVLALVGVPAAGAVGLAHDEPVEITIRYTAGWTPVLVTFPPTMDCEAVIQTSAPPTFIVTCGSEGEACEDPTVEAQRLALLGGIEGAAACGGSQQVAASCGIGPADPPVEHAVQACREVETGAASPVFTCLASPQGQQSLMDPYGEVTCRFTHVG